MIKKTLFFWFLGIFLSIPSVQAGINEDIQSDSTRMAQWFSQEFGDAMAFNTSVGPLIPGNVPSTLGFVVGGAGGVSLTKLDLDTFRGLPLLRLDNKGDEIALPDDLPVPSVLGHGKVGLPWGLDVGVKSGGFSFDKKVKDSSLDISNRVVGIEVRKKIIGGAVFPFVSASLAFDSANGEITRKETYNGAITGGTLNASTELKTKWDVGATTARVLASKKILIITPFVGVGVTKLRGKTDTTITNTGAAVVSGVPVTVSHTTVGSADSDETLTHGLLGMEISLFPFVRLHLAGLVAKENRAASIGLRVQFR
jgi:hypothetical protein